MLSPKEKLLRMRAASKDSEGIQTLLAGNRQQAGFQNAANLATHIQKAQKRSTSTRSINMLLHRSSKQSALDTFNSVFLVMSYEEQDLKSVIRSTRHGTRLSEKHILTIIYNSLCCLNYLHSKGIVHRDIKPANMLVGDDCQILMCDFGLARALPTQPLYSRQTHKRAQSFLNRMQSPQRDRREKIE